MPEFRERRAALARRLKKLNVDALLVSFLPNVRYLTGFTGSNALLIVTADTALVLSDSRYEEQLRRETDVPARMCKISLWRAAAQWAGREGVRQAGVESARVTLEQQAALARHLPKNAAIASVGRVIEELRMVKSPTEIQAISRAVQINSMAYAAALARFEAGMTERALAAEIDYQMRRAGADGNAFETIVASGERSALPHARPTGAAIEQNRLLLIDMGAQAEGYASDMTRVVSPGRIASESKRLYSAVLEAQLAAIDMVRPGVKAVDVDAAARKTLEKQQLDGLFKHSTGHGLGLEIHERPRLGKRDHTRLRAGMVITIEPGVYQPGTGGVRIEDTVLVTETGCAVLTPTSKKFAAI